jgi:hypothetical protein
MWFLVYINVRLLIIHTHCHFLAVKDNFFAISK